MGRRFVPLPYDAANLCGNEREIACVFALYRRAHEARWGPFVLSVREFAKAGAISVGAASALLRDLEAAGLLVRAHATHQSRPDTVTVLDPAADLPERQPEHEREHQDADRSAQESADRERHRERHREQLTHEEVPAHVGDHDHDHDPPPSEENNTPPPPAPPEAEEPPEALPRWAKQHTPPPGMHRRDLVAVVVGVKEAVFGTPINPERCGDAARTVLALWRADGERPPDAFLADMRLVVDAAQSCPLPLFARDIRAEGWAGGTDRRRSIATLCVLERWSERLAAAQAWDADGRSSQSLSATGPPARAAPSGRESMLTQLSRLAADADEPAPLRLLALPGGLDGQ